LLWRIAYLDAAAFQQRTQLSEMLMVSGFDRADNVHSRNIRAGERPVMDDLFDARACRSDEAG
jgi:hypothetical protein